MVVPVVPASKWVMVGLKAVGQLCVWQLCCKSVRPSGDFSPYHVPGPKQHVSNPFNSTPDPQPYYALQNPTH